VRGNERTLAVGLTDRGRALRAEAERIPPAIVERLGLPLADLERLRAELDAVIAATRTAPGDGAGSAQSPGAVTGTAR